MENPNQFLEKYFKIIASGQAYLNTLYLLLAFPLGIFYFTFLVTGLATAIPLIIIWVGLILLPLVMGAWWLLAAFERQLAIHLLKEEIPPMSPRTKSGEDIWARLKDFLLNPVTWKSLVYLFLKFPLGIFGFVVVVTLTSLTLVLLSAPLTYQLFEMQVIASPTLSWQINTLNNAVIATLVGILLWPASLWAFHGLAWINAKFAKLMLAHNLAGTSSGAGQNAAQNQTEVAKAASS